MRGISLGIKLFKQKSAHAGCAVIMPVFPSETLCNGNDVLAKASSLAHAQFQNRYPSPTRSGSKRIRPSLGCHSGRKSTRFGGYLQIEVEFERNSLDSRKSIELFKELVSCSNLLGSSQQLHSSRLALACLRTTSNVALSAQPSAQPLLTSPAMTASLALPSARVLASSATTSAHANNQLTSRAGVTRNHLNRRRGRPSSAAVLHSKDPCTCSRRS